MTCEDVIEESGICSLHCGLSVSGNEGYLEILEDK